MAGRAVAHGSNTVPLNGYGNKEWKLVRDACPFLSSEKTWSILKQSGGNVEKSILIALSGNEMDTSVPNTHRSSMYIPSGAIQAVPISSFRVILDVSTAYVDIGKSEAVSTGRLRYSVCFWPKGKNIGLVFQHSNKFEEEVCVKSVMTNEFPMSDRSKEFESHEEYLGELAGVRVGDVVRGMNYELFCGCTSSNSSGKGGISVEIQDLYDIIESVTQFIVIHFERTVPSSRINRMHNAAKDTPQDTNGFFSRIMTNHGTNPRPVRKNSAPPSLSSSPVGSSSSRHVVIEEMHPYTKLFLDQHTIAIDRGLALEKILRHLKYHQAAEWQRYMYKVVSNHTKHLKIKKVMDSSAVVSDKLKRVCLHGIEINVTCHICRESVLGNYYEPLQLDCRKFIKDWDRLCSSPHRYYHEPLSYCPISNPLRPSAAHILRPLLCTRLVRTETRRSADQSPSPKASVDLSKSGVYYITWVMDISSGAEWMVKKRYTDYVEFRKALMAVRSSVISSIPFPPKRLLRVMDTYITIPERLALLQMRQIYEHFFEVPLHITTIHRLDSAIKTTPDMHLERQLQIFGHHIMNLQEMENVVENYLHKYHTEVLQEISPSAAASAGAAGADAMLWNISNGLIPLTDLKKFMDDLQCALESILLCGSSDGAESSDFWAIISTGLNVIKEGLEPFDIVNKDDHQIVECPWGAPMTTVPPIAVAPEVGGDGKDSDEEQGFDDSEDLHANGHDRGSITSPNIYDTRTRSVSISSYRGRSISRSSIGNIPLPAIAPPERNFVPTPMDYHNIRPPNPPNSPPGSPKVMSSSYIPLTTPMKARQLSKGSNTWRTTIAKSASSTNLNVYSTAATASSRLPHHVTHSIASSAVPMVQSNHTITPNMHRPPSPSPLAVIPSMESKDKEEGEAAHGPADRTIDFVHSDDQDDEELKVPADTNSDGSGSIGGRSPVLLHLPSASVSSTSPLHSSCTSATSRNQSNRTSPMLDLKSSNLTAMSSRSSSLTSETDQSPDLAGDVHGLHIAGQLTDDAVPEVMTSPTTLGGDSPFYSPTPVRGKCADMTADTSPLKEGDGEGLQAMSPISSIEPDISTSGRAASSGTSSAEGDGRRTSSATASSTSMHSGHKNTGAEGSNSNSGHSNPHPHPSADVPIDPLQTYSNELLHEDVVSYIGQTAIRKLIEIHLYIPVCARLRSYLHSYYMDSERVLVEQLRALSDKPQEFFGIPVKHRSPSHWKEAIVAMRKIKTFSLPYTKINAFLSAIQCIPTIYFAEHTTSDVCFGADDFLPVFIYILVKAKISHLLSLNMELQVLCDNERKSAEAGYYLTTLDASIQHLMEMDTS